MRGAVLSFIVCDVLVKTALCSIFYFELSLNAITYPSELYCKVTYRAMKYCDNSVAYEPESNWFC
jgi:hypothetical protein